MREVYGGVREVTLPAVDPQASRAFYVDRLGFAVVDEPASGGVRVNLGTFRLRITGPGPDGPLRGGAPTLTFRVANLRRTALELTSRGVGFDAVPRKDGADTLVVTDPDGVRLLFVERI